MNRLFDDVDDGNRERVLSSGVSPARRSAAAKKFGKRLRICRISSRCRRSKISTCCNRIAAEIERRYGACVTAPALLPGHDVSGINLGFPGARRHRYRGVEQLFAGMTLRADGSPLFSRPPLYLEACYRKMPRPGQPASALDARYRRSRAARAVCASAGCRPKPSPAWTNRLQQSRAYVACCCSAISTR